MKTWIKANLSKITLALALTGAISGTIGLIVGSIAQNKTNHLTYFFDYYHEAHWGEGIIWARPVNNKHKIILYWASNKLTDDAVKWDGIYPDGYFDN